MDWLNANNSIIKCKRTRIYLCLCVSMCVCNCVSECINLEETDSGLSHFSRHNPSFCVSQ